MTSGAEDGPAQPGLVFRQAHFPGRAPIDSYGNGGFRFAEMSHKGSILCVPSGIYAWHPAMPADLEPASFRRVVDEVDQVELLFVGMGTVPFPLAEPVKAALRDAGIRFEIMATGAAVRTFNVLLAENRRVAAGLLAVE